MERKAEVERVTSETDIKLWLNLDGKGEAKPDTELPFLNHMLELWARHGFFDLEVKGRGDIQVEPHHLVEDVGICLGQALKEALGSKERINRYGHCFLPMDDALVLAAVDLSGRPFLNYDLSISPGKVGAIDVEVMEEFWRAVVSEGALNLHLKLFAGRNRHHIIEAVFKGAGRAMRDACSRRDDFKGVLSTKGIL